MKHLRSLVIALVLFTSGSALAYDSFTLGLQAEVTGGYAGFNAHAVWPVIRFSVGTNTAALSIRADVSAAVLAYFGLAAVVSGTGSGVQPFASLGAGATLLGGPPLVPAFQGLVGARIPLANGFYMVAQFQLRAADGGAFPGLGVGVEYSF